MDDFEENGDGDSTTSIASLDSDGDPFTMEQRNFLILSETNENNFFFKCRYCPLESTQLTHRDFLNIINNYVDRIKSEPQDQDYKENIEFIKRNSQKHFVVKF